jgi:hypothetical protein
LAKSGSVFLAREQAWIMLRLTDDNAMKKEMTP